LFALQAKILQVENSYTWKTAIHTGADFTKILCSIFFSGIDVPNNITEKHHGNHTSFFLHHHSRSGRLTRRILHMFTTIILVVALILVSIATYFLWRNYKKRWKMQEEACNINEPPVSLNDV